MHSTGPMARHGRVVLAWVREWRLPAPERRAARTERAVERRMRQERDKEQNAFFGAEAEEAERRRQETLLGHRP